MRTPARVDAGDAGAPVRQPGEPLVRISGIGLCGTDYHIFAGNQPIRLRLASTTPGR